MECNHNIGARIGKAHHLFLMELDRMFREKNLPITAEQFKMMVALWKQDGVSQQSISNEVCRNKAATGRMIDVLEKHGLIERHPHPTDRRLNLIFLTRMGKQAEKDAQQCVRELTEKSIQGFSSSEIQAFESMIDRLILNLE